MTDIYVRTDTQFNDAIKNAQPGDTIYLAPGTYAPIMIRSVDLDIAITSLDPDDPAIMTGLTMRDASGVTFSNLKMAAPAGSHNIFTVFGAKDVSFDAIEMYGPDNLGSGEEVVPFIIRESERVSVTNSEFYNLKHGVQLLNVEQVTVDGNSFHNIRIDGVRGGGVSNSQISNNNFTDFFPGELDHADAIQLWSTQQTEAAENILITGNVIVRGAGEPIQGIFIRDTYSELPFKNVTITDNVVVGGSYNGITVDGVIGGTITGNLVAGYEDQRSFLRVIMDQDTNVSANTSTRYVFDTRDSPHHSANQSIPESGVDYASAIPDGSGSDFFALRPTDVMNKVAQLTGQEQPSQPEPEPPVIEIPLPEEPVDIPQGGGGPVDEEPPVDETPVPETPPSDDTPPTTPIEENDDNTGPAPPPAAGGNPDDNDNEARAVHVSSDAELKEAVNNAQPGDTIYLAAGNYAPLTIKAAHLDITIASLDPENPAVMTGLTMRDSSGVAFSNLEMAAPLGTLNVFTVIGSSDISFDSIEMHGPDNMGSGSEVSPFIIRQSENVSVTNSVFYNVNHAVQLLDVEQVAISGNTFHDVKGGAVRGGGVSNAQIADNHFSDFRPDGGSANAIQLWTTNQNEASGNIAITGNVIVRGDGDIMQGIFIRDQGGKLPFTNVTVADNIVLGGSYNAIMVDGVIGGTVTGNLVAGYEDQRSWIRVISDKETVVSANSATSYIFDGTNNPHLAVNQTIPEHGVDYSLIAASGMAESFAGLSPAVLLDKVAQLAAQDHAMPQSVPAPAPLKEIRGTDGDDKFSGTAGNDLMIGGNGNDTLYGLGGNDHILGGDGDDMLEGHAGDDLLFGGNGNDLIIGGIGNDIMTGGAGVDTFLFRNGDLGNGSLDIITDFELGIDRPIHLRGVDANTNTVQDDNFTFIGNAAFSGKAGQLNYFRTSDGILVGGDLDGDGVADFGILLKGLSSISAGDFLL